MTDLEDHFTKSPKNSPAIPVWMWGAVAALLLFAAYQLWETIQVKKTIEATNEQEQQEIAKRHDLEEKFSVAQREAIILTDPRSVKISLSAENKEMPKMEAVWHAKLGIVVSGLNVPAPSGARILQLWLIRKDGQSSPARGSRPDVNGQFVLLEPNPSHDIGLIKALAITEEPTGGSPQPTTKPIWLGAIS